jgi:hypothetical protein
LDVTHAGALTKSLMLQNSEATPAAIAGVHLTPYFGFRLSCVQTQIAEAPPQLLATDSATTTAVVGTRLAA